MRIHFLAAFAAGIALLASASSAATQAPPLEAYGALPVVEHIEISPDGTRLALVTVAGEDRLLAVVDPGAGAMLGRIEVGLAKVRDLAWVGDDKLMITTSSTQSLSDLGGWRGELWLGQVYDVERSRLVSVLHNAPRVSSLLYGYPVVRSTTDGADLFVRAFSAGSGLISLYRIDPATGRGREAARLDGDTSSVVLDASGQPLAAAQYEDGSGRWRLRFWNGRAFDEVWSTVAPLDPPRLLGLGRDGRSVVVSAIRGGAEDVEDEDGAGLFEVDAAGTWTPLPFEHRPTFLLWRPDDGRLVGGAFEYDAGVEYSFLDPAAAGAWEQAAAALAGRRPELVSWSHDFQTLLIYTSGTGDSGTYHRIDLARRSLDVVGPAYPGVTGDQVGEVRPIEYAAADGLDIRGYLTLPAGVATPAGLPLVVLVHGGPASRDGMGFDWMAQAIASRGYAVLQANFRGSTGRGRTFLEAGYGEWGRKMQTDLSDGVRWLAEQGIIDPERVCIAGASYGGYAALAGPTLDRGVYRCAVAIAGVSDLRRMVEAEARLARPNSETVRYWNRFMGAARLGDRAIDALSPARLASEADAPILLIHGRDDTVVPIEQSRLMAAALRDAGKPVELIELDGEDHWLSRSDTRLRTLTEMIDFLMEHNPPD